MNTERWEEAGRVRHRLRWVRWIGLAVVACTLMGAAGRAGYRLAVWQVTGDSARCVAGNAHAPTADRVQAIVGMQRDVGLHVALLHQMAQEPGEVGEHARNALAHLRERCR